MSDVQFLYYSTKTLHGPLRLEYTFILERISLPFWFFRFC